MLNYGCDYLVVLHLLMCPGTKSLPHARMRPAPLEGYMRASAGNMLPAHAEQLISICFATSGAQAMCLKSAMTRSRRSGQPTGHLVSGVRCLDFFLCQPVRISACILHAASTKGWP